MKTAERLINNAPTDEFAQLKAYCNKRKLSPAITIADRTLIKMLREANVDIGNHNYIATLFWEGDFMNDCYKALPLEADWSEEHLDELDEYDDECKINAIYRKNVKNFLKTLVPPSCDEVLIDVSW
jgi:hypothetical protein